MSQAEEKLMDNQPVDSSQAFINQLQECSEILAEKLQGDHYDEASKLISDLMESRDQHIFQSVGQLTRALHDSIVNFNVEGDLTQAPPDVEGSEMQDASNRLNYVIDLTQKAADTTMDMVDASAPIAMNLAEQASTIKDEWSRLRQREMSAEEFRALCTKMEGFFESMDNGTREINGNLQNIILEQGFQDLTGQVLRKVITLINDVETNLVSLVRIAGQVEEVTGIITNPKVKDSSETGKGRDLKGEGPIMNADKREDVACSQDDVDDLLSSLGF